MLHKTRRWRRPQEASSDLALLAEHLAGHTWVVCNAWKIEAPDGQTYLLLNDSTSEDGIQEYAVVVQEESGEYRQIESITFGWMDSERALKTLNDILAGAYSSEDYWRGELRFHEPGETCYGCA